jgi:hypothetical protein
MELVTRVTAASGKAYQIAPGGAVTGGRQYIDRDYRFDYVPALVRGQTHILTAGNDKMIDEHAPCLRIELGAAATVYVVYADKLRVLPRWLEGYCDTREKITRTDSNPSTLKGIFTLFSQAFDAGVVTLYGNLSAAMRDDPTFQASGPLGTNYCMYSVIIKQQRP